MCYAVLPESEHSQKNKGVIEGGIKIEDFTVLLLWKYLGGMYLKHILLMIDIFINS